MQDIFVDFQAINATNLDGGTSTTMTLNNEMINKSCSSYGGRKVCNAWLVQ
jgi:exopolysaccharide biosynthesis protein